MSQFLGQILTFLTTLPGNTIYHIVLVFSIAGALLEALQSLRSSNFPQERRTVIGLSIMLGLQLVLFILSGLSSKGLLNSQVVFPPLDRAVTLLSLVWIAWLWAFPEPVRMADAATLLLNLLGIVAFGLTLALWAQSTATSFNLSIYETGWQVFSITVILLGILGTRFTQAKWLELRPGRADPGPVRAYCQPGLPHERQFPRLCTVDTACHVSHPADTFTPVPISNPDGSICCQVPKAQ